MGFDEKLFILLYFIDAQQFVDYNDDEVICVKYLILLRKNRGLTQKNVAEQLGISPQAYANYEAGRREPDIQMLMKLARYFQVSLDELLEYDSSAAKKHSASALTPHEQKVIVAYRKQPAMQGAVDKLLGIES